MALISGTRLGPYEILSALGAGGMGEVYRARDTKLNRDVAIKVLPDLVAHDRDRLARFTREAQTLASLNHPHIAAIYGLEESGGIGALVMELVEGEDLSQRIARGPMPLTEVLPIASQLAGALEAAHALGIIHRDLKPANIQVRRDGAVKVLDFGLAKALEPANHTSGTSQAPTITSPATTRAGSIMGTAAYMSPEQARGDPANEQSDIWAFGCVLYECLTGARAFPGETVTDTLASILRSEPEWSRLPAGTSDALRRLLRRCLQKDRARRLADIRDAMLELVEPEDASTAVPAAAPPSRTRERLLWATGVAILAVAVLMLSLRQLEPAVRPVEYSYLDIPATTDPSSFALSPDGRHAVFVAAHDGRPQLWHYSFDTGQRRRLPGTAGAAYPFWSPNNRAIGFFTNERLYRMEIEGGAPRALAFAPYGAGGTWSRDETILFTPVPDAPVMRVTDAFGDGEPLPRQGAAGGERFPQFLPDGRHFVFYTIETRQVFLGSVDSPQRTLLVDSSDSAAVVAPPDGLLFVRGGRLLAQRLDPLTFTTVGEPRSVGENVAIDGRGAAALSASAEGSVLYRTGSGDQPRQLVIVDREGKNQRKIGPPDRSFPLNPDLCPGDKTVVVNRSIAGNTGIDLIDLDRGVPTTLTREALPEIVPVCSRRGVLFATVGGPGTAKISRIAAGGSTAIVLVPDAASLPLDEAEDGTLLYRTRGRNTGWDIWAIDVNARPRVILNGPTDERSAQLSPDGKWLVYESMEAGGVFEIVVQSYPAGRGKRQVSNGGGSQPRWEGHDIFYVAADGYLTAVRAVPSADGQNIELARSPERLFPAPVESTIHGGIAYTYAVFRDGRQFLFSTFTELTAQSLSVIRNLRWGKR